MKIGILSTNPKLYSTQRLKEAAEDRGHDTEVVNYLRCYMKIDSEDLGVVYQGEPLTGFDAVIPRVGATYTFYGTAVVRQFEMMGIFSANESQAISRSRDKLRSLQLLARAGIAMPATGFAHSTKDVKGLIRTIGGAPLVIKLLEGTQGIGVVLAETQKAAESVIEAFRGLDANILVQEFVKESAGSDVRCFVVGGRVVAAMKRTAPPGEFRSNLHRGGTGEPVELTVEEKRIATRAVKVMGLSVAGVDLLQSDEGPMVLEVNSSPGLEGIERTTGKDVAGRIIRYVETHAAPGRTRDRGKG